MREPTSRRETGVSNSRRYWSNAKPRAACEETGVTRGGARAREETRVTRRDTRGAETCRVFASYWSRSRRYWPTIDQLPAKHAFSTGKFIVRPDDPRRCPTPRRARSAMTFCSVARLAISYAFKFSSTSTRSNGIFAREPVLRKDGNGRTTSRRRRRPRSAEGEGGGARYPPTRSHRRGRTPAKDEDRHGEETVTHERSRPSGAVLQSRSRGRPRLTSARPPSIVEGCAPPASRSWRPSSFRRLLSIERRLDGRAPDGEHAGRGLGDRHVDPRRSRRSPTAGRPTRRQQTSPSTRHRPSPLRASPSATKPAAGIVVAGDWPPRRRLVDGDDRRDGDGHADGHGGEPSDGRPRDGDVREPWSPSRRSSRATCSAFRLEQRDVQRVDRRRDQLGRRARRGCVVPRSKAGQCETMSSARLARRAAAAHALSGVLRPGTRPLFLGVRRERHGRPRMRRGRHRLAALDAGALDLTAGPTLTIAINAQLAFGPTSRRVPFGKLMHQRGFLFFLPESIHRSPACHGRQFAHAPVHRPQCYPSTRSLSERRPRGAPP